MSTPRAPLPFGAMYAPFCRTANVPLAEWEKDLRQMREHGFTVLHGFAEWHKIEPNEGEYNFAELDFLADLCGKIGLDLVINVATHVGYGFYPPRWFMRQYKGAGIVDHLGHEDVPRGLYVIPCPDDTYHIACASRFIQATGSRYAHHPAVKGWIIWGEPTLSRTGKLTCYCEHTIARFRTWLREKYGDIEALNAAWRSEGPTDFTDFGEVWPPAGAGRHKGGFAPFLDWRTFSARNMTRNIALVKQALEQGGAMQPKIVEMFWYPGTDRTANSVDVDEVSNIVDIIGVSCFSKPGWPMAASLAKVRGAAQRTGKPFWIIEARGGPAYFTTPGEGGTPTPEEVTAEALQAYSHGAKGFMYWTYRPRLTDFEAGEFGLAKKDGAPTPRLLAAKRAARILCEIGGDLVTGTPRSQVAVADSLLNQYLANADNLHSPGVSPRTAVEGACRLFYDLGVSVDVTSLLYSTLANLQNYRLLVLPYLFLCDEREASLLAEYVRAGGMVIADAGIGIRTSDGFCRYNPPGPLSAVFGAIEDDMTAPVPGVRNITWDNSLTHPSFGLSQALKPLTAIPIAHFENGAVAATKHRYELGTTIWVGTGLFASYAASPGATTRELVRRLMEGQVDCDLAWQGDDPVEVQSLISEDGKQAVVFLLNANHERSAQGQLHFRREPVSVKEIGNDELSFTGAGNELPLTIPPMAHRVLRVTYPAR
jgi:beta-galactosidase